MSITKDTSARKTERNEFRSTSAQKELILRGAEITGKNPSDFILENAVLAAEMAILEQRVFPVSGQEFAWWEELLEAETQPHPGLDRLFSKPLSWPKD
jgi:uncharacterized protein (DUF1778 family)